ncbi:MAG: 16S rRNA (cytosine(1402)-N(4))-methyltransferase RsmH [bacterium]|nr:16S rRNA (cytosine(1402)-N(4))-methyltransferase RsmH [bacterium]
MEFSHEPVLTKQILNHLNITKGDWHIDMTAGGGGHLDLALGLGANCFALDQDQDSFAFLIEKYKKLGWRELETTENMVSLQKEDQKLNIVNSNFENFDKYIHEQKFKSVLFDFGMSSYQIEGSKRGFSFMRDEALDMRMDKNLTITAKDLINVLSVNELGDLFNRYGEDRFSKMYAREIVKIRKIQQITTTKELADLILRVCPVKERKKLHPATRIFQALRIAVNDELHSIQITLPKIALALETEGRILTITFHSLEEKLVTEFITERSDLNIKAESFEADDQEVIANPRSRSARLTVLQIN